MLLKPNYGKDYQSPMWSIRYPVSDFLCCTKQPTAAPETILTDTWRTRGTGARTSYCRPDS